MTPKMRLHVGTAFNLSFGVGLFLSIISLQHQKFSANWTWIGWNEVFPFLAASLVGLVTVQIGVFATTGLFRGLGYWLWAFPLVYGLAFAIALISWAIEMNPIWSFLLYPFALGLVGHRKALAEERARRAKFQ